MDFVDDVDLFLSFDRGVTDAVDEVSDLVDAIIARRVDFDDVWVGVRIDCLAVGALVALMTDALLAVQSLGEKAGHGGFSGSARAAEKIGVRYLAAIDGVSDCPNDGLLSSDLFESRGSVFVVKSFIGHIRNYNAHPLFFLGLISRLARHFIARCLMV